MRAWRALELVALASWAGAMVCFGALVAPALFRAVPSREVAGQVAAVTAGLDRWGMAAFGLAAVALLARWRHRHARWRLLPVLAGLAVVVVSATWVRGGLEAAKARMDRPIEQYAWTDPLRVEYNRWHRLSTQMGMAALALAGGALVWAAVAPGEE